MINVLKSTNDLKEDENNYMQKIEKERKKREISQKALAEHLKISVQQYQKIKTRRSHLSCNNFIKIAEYFKIDPRNLLSDNVTKIAKSRKVDAETKREIDEIISLISQVNSRSHLEMITEYIKLFNRQNKIVPK